MLQLAKCHVAHCKGLGMAMGERRGVGTLAGNDYMCDYAGEESISYPLCNFVALTSNLHQQCTTFKKSLVFGHL